MAYPKPPSPYGPTRGRSASTYQVRSSSQPSKERSPSAAAGAAVGPNAPVATAAVAAVRTATAATRTAPRRRPVGLRVPGEPAPGGVGGTGAGVTSMAAPRCSDRSRRSVRAGVTPPTPSWFPPRRGSAPIGVCPGSRLWWNGCCTPGVELKETDLVLVRRALVALVALLGVAALVVGIGMRTVWLPADTATATADLSDGPVALTAPGVMEMRAGPVTATLTGDGPLHLARMREAGRAGLGRRRGPHHGHRSVRRRHAQHRRRRRRAHRARPGRLGDVAGQRVRRGRGHLHLGGPARPVPARGCGRRHQGPAAAHPDLAGRGHHPVEHAADRPRGSCSCWPPWGSPWCCCAGRRATAAGPSATASGPPPRGTTRPTPRTDGGRRDPARQPPRGGAAVTGRADHRAHPTRAAPAAGRRARD